MNGRKNTSGTRNSGEVSSEVRLKARAVSRGVAIGKVVSLHGNNRQFYRINIKQSEVVREIKRLRKAVSAAKLQLTKLIKANGSVTDSGAGIFEVHLALIADSSLLEKFEREIEAQKVNAEWAIKHVTEIYVSKYKAIEDEHLRDRYIDIEDVTERILTALDGSHSTQLPYAKDSIIVARELKPSTLVELADDSPRAVITENGGWTSHTFIIAREMKLPAVTGLKKIFRRVKTGDRVIVDGFNGQVILNPDEKTIAEFKPAAEATNAPTDRLQKDEPLKTLDGREIHIFANSDTPQSFRNAAALGAEGVGLYRSEFLFDRNRGFPSEAKQFAAYRAIAEAAGPGRVKIRTFDLGADRLLDQNPLREKNPALGLRAVRLGLSYQKVLRVQLRSLLRAAAVGNIDLVIPMASGVSEIREVKRLLSEEAELLTARDKKFGKPGIGVMIEVPSAVMMIEDILNETDFVCLGTNDLIQYLLAVDRDNESVAGWYRSLHPAVLKAIGRVIDASRRSGRAAIICGEMAGSPYYVPILIGLGATVLSMNANSIDRVRRMVSGIAAEEAERLVKQLAAANCVEDVELLAERSIRKNWIHLFPEGFSFA